MQAKEYMLRASRAEAELRLIYKRRQHYSELATAIGVKLTGMPHATGNSSRVEAGAVALVDLDEELAMRMETYRGIIRDADKKIAQIKQDKFREILTRKYLCMQSWKTIRDEMDYKDEKSVYRCHGYALRELQKLL